MIKRAHLRHFVALAETGRFTAAARRLNLTQPTLSASIADLERLVGGALLIREKRAIRLTEGGIRLFALARSIEKEFRAAETTLAPGSARLLPLTLGVLPSISTKMLVSLRQHFGCEQPLVLIEGSDAELRRRLAEQQINAALTTIRLNESAGPLLEEMYGVLLSSAHAFADRHELLPEELSGEVMIARRSCEILSETSKFFTARGVRPHFLMRSANEDRCLSLVREGFGITTGPESLAGNGVLCVPLTGYTYRRSIGLLFSPNSASSVLADAWAKALN